MARQRGVKIPITAQDLTEAAFESASRNARRLEGQLDQTSAASARMARSSRGTRGALGQLGFQIQDVAVQLQSGQNALLVFGQQGSQIASIFGPGGAVIGAFLAVGAAIGTALLPSLFDSTEASEELEAALEAVAAIASTTDDDILVLSQAMAELAETSRDAAGVQLAAAVVQAEGAVRAGVRAIGEAVNEEFGGFFGYDIEDAVAQLQTVKDEGLTLGQVLSAGMAPATLETERLRHSVGDLAGLIRDLSEEMSVNEAAAFDLLSAYAALGDEPTEEELSAFLDTVVALAPAGTDAADTLRGFQSSLIGLQQAAANANEELKALQGAQASFNETGDLPETEDEASVREANEDAYVEGLARMLEADVKYAQESGQTWDAAVAQRAQASRQILAITASQSQQMAQLTDQNSAAGKAFFAIQQSLAAANAIISGLAAGPAIMEAYAKLAAATGQPWLVGVGQAHATAAKVMGFATAGAIMAQTVASFEGGGFTGLGPRSGGMDGKGGFPAILHPNETVIDHTRGQGGGVAVREGDFVMNIQATDAKSFQRQLTQNRGSIYSMIDQYHRRKGGGARGGRR